MTGLNKENLYYLLREFLWLLITATLVYIVLYPITSKIDYIYWRINAFFVFISITYFRYTISFRSLPFLRPSWIRFLLFTVNLSLIIYLAHNEQKLMSMADNFYIEDFGWPRVFISDLVKKDFFKYLYTELVFFGTASIITCIAFELRLIVSYWQYYKHQANLLMED